MMKNYLYDVFEHWGNEIYCISDPHFGDLESYKFRFVKNTEIRDGSKKYYQTFETIWEDEDSLKCSMECFDEWQIKNINSVAGKASTLIILGDVGDLECVKKLKAKRKILIMGNHDKGASNYKRVKYTKDFIYSFESWDEFVNRMKSENDSLVEFRGASEKGEDVYTAYYDNHLFDEVYEGPLMINDKCILSHEPIFPTLSFVYNVHGHVHNAEYKGDEHHLNCCAEAIDYKPINLLKLFKTGKLKHIDSIHRMTINNAVARKAGK